MVVEDDVDLPEPDRADMRPSRLSLTSEEIARLLDEDPSKLGSMSIGKPNAGALFNGVQMPRGDWWIIRNPRETWGTQETIDYIIAAIRKVHERYPDTPRIYIGDISSRRGGRLNRHLSHQAGRDVDLGWYYKGGERYWYLPATRKTLDLPRTWALVRAFLTETDVQLILIDRSVQRLLYAYAKDIGEDQAWLDSVFQYPKGRWNAIIRHVPGHKTHIHVRFYNPVAQELGRRAYKALLARHLIKPPIYYVKHRARRGDSLIKIARRYGSSVAAIRRFNGLRSNLIRAGRIYRIPKKGGVHLDPRPVAIPSRRLPPYDPLGPAKPGIMDRVVAIAGEGIRTLRGDAPAVSLFARSSVAGPSARPKRNGAKPGITTITTRRGSPREAPRSAKAKGRSTRQRRKASARAKERTRRTKARSARNRERTRRRSRWSTYRVRSGDNLWTIARRKGVTVADLKRWNRLKSELLHPGQRLKIRRRK